ncbi:MAG: stage V sporulation protein D, partial [Firmicutes bacterium]|nr:stage V sporulation protein D [Bacillota bacterium]
MASPNKPNVKNKITLVMIFLLVVLLFVGLAVRLGYHMIVKAEDYSEMAVRQQTSDNIVSAVRGKILDRNGNEFAVSTNSYTVWVRPASVRGNGKTEAEKAYNIQQEAQALADVLKLDYDSVYASITADSALRKVAKYVDLDTANDIRSLGLAGIELTEEPSRNYPLGTFACHIIGNTNDDNIGISGLELYYENLLEGINGRWITNKDAKKNSLPFGTDKYYGAVDGYTLVTTVDQNIQFIVEQKLASCQMTTQAARVMCIVMDPKTAEILAMAQTPAYDLNDPRAPITEEDAAMMEVMTSEEKVAYWNRLWRNFCVSDTYEPGSTFKLITTSIALDNGVTNQTETFYCSPRTVADYTLKCWYSPRSHGQETLAQAVQNSCNPVMIDLAQRLGLTKYYAGLDAFCLTEKTGVDFPGEGSNILQNRRTAGPVGLATMSYGQGIAVTPISLITAISSIANGGKLMQPHFLKAVYD